MPPEIPNPPSGETRTSLRDVAEQAWEDVVENAPEGDEPDQAEVDGEAPQRDSRGRFVAADRAEPGEAEAPAEPPSPDEIDAPTKPDPTQPREGVAAAAPANWSEADRKEFAEIPPRGQAFVLRRISEIEGGLQRAVQANAQAAQFTQAIAPVFQDARMQASLQQMGVTPQDAINEWSQFHLRAVSPNLVDRANLVLDLAARIGVPLNPAAIGQPSQQGLPPEAVKDPAIKFFAEHVANNASEVQALKAQVQSFIQKSQHQEEQEAVRATKWGIDAFADAKDQQGNLLHPDFDEVVRDIAKLYRIDPRLNLAEAYETACGMNPTVRARRIEREVAAQVKRLSDQRAAQASKLNLRGRTSPVTGPAGSNGDGRSMSLRDTLEATADELGI